ncbi:hypothetical protein AGOR_G00078440 [Albula goreensis]|uniref:Caspase-8 n=1 Tax=Albula goreensis TaxID=1534307 RepID=A0A8T3DSY1_9TELE|nr:hypothetical protein AGOR_G00078440 [Albula goreensis]
MDFSPGCGAERMELLHEIDGELDSGDVAALKFLCRDIVPQKKLELVRSGRELFLRLEEQGLLEHGLLIVAELLDTISRKDLVRRLQGRCAEVQQFLQDRRASNSGITPYRKMLYRLSEDVTEEDLSRMKPLLRLPRSKLEPSVSFLDVLVAMEKQELLKEDSLGLLEELCAACDKRLAVRVREFAGSSVRPSCPDGGRQQPPSSLNLPQNPPAPVSVSSRVSVGGGISMDTGPESRHEESYDVRRRPRGHCVIINNYNFAKAMATNPILRLNNREGTDVDADALYRVFSRLHFQVHQRRDLDKAALLGVVEEFGSMSHRHLDAFVCCVLSHGKKGHVYGTDGELVTIRQLTQHFTSSGCPSLAGKPKLFFIQACQALDPEGRFEADGEGPGDIDDDAAPDLPAPEPPVPETIPNDSDFLVGMATVEDHKSYRHTHRGSAYVQQLCSQLETGCAQKDDILTILTRVNREVSGQVYGGFRQMPEPRYTLTKKLILTTD